MLKVALKSIMFAFTVHPRFLQKRLQPKLPDSGTIHYPDNKNLKLESATLFHAAYQVSTLSFIKCHPCLFFLYGNFLTL